MILWFGLFFVALYNSHSLALRKRGQILTNGSVLVDCTTGCNSVNFCTMVLYYTTK
jgi:hypothetical protein